MKINKKIIWLICALPLLGGCSDFLNINDESAINSDIWNSEASAMLFVNKIYAMSGPSFGGEKVASSGLSSCSDETNGLPDLLVGSLEGGTVGAYSADRYQSIRYINIALDEMKGSSMPKDAYNRVVGQLYFFRAWQHWNMMIMHGGVPYMTEVVGYTSEDDLKNAPRNKTSECIEFVKKDLKDAIEMLPSNWASAEWGRVTNATAAALLGRILLFYASPQFTPDQTSQFAHTRWQEAYDANKNAVAICKVGGYGLLDCSTTKTDKWLANTDINNVFLKEGTGNIEALFVRVYDDNQNAHSYEQSVRPEGQTKAKESSNLPTLRLMKAFPNADGTPYTKADNDMSYWKDRDSRFYSTIVYNGCYLPYIGNSNYRQWTYSKAYSDVNTYSTTGFYCRKMLNPATVSLDKTSTNWIEIRYAEVLLNLAEAALEVGDTDLMYDCLGQIRKRAGIPEGEYFYGLKADPSSNLELVMNERFIELAFEGKRFYDLRRRNMFTQDLGQNVKALNGEKKMGWAVKNSFIKFGDANAEKFKKERDGLSMDEIAEWMKVAKVTPVNTAKPINYICYPDRESLSVVQSGSYNFFDLPDGIITRSPAIKQTMGWSYDTSRGCFDPFE